MKTKQQIEDMLKLLKADLNEEKQKQKQKQIKNDRSEEMLTNIRNQSFLRTEIDTLEWVLREDN